MVEVQSEDCEKTHSSNLYKKSVSLESSAWLHMSIGSMVCGMSEHGAHTVCEGLLETICCT